MTELSRVRLDTLFFVSPTTLVTDWRLLSTDCAEPRDGRSAGAGWAWTLVVADSAAATMVKSLNCILSDGEGKIMFGKVVLWAAWGCDDLRMKLLRMMMLKEYLDSFGGYRCLI